MELVKSAALSGVVLQLEIRLLGLSPMVWRRVLVPESMSLHELHGVVQMAMGWEGIHLFEFAVRGARYAEGDSPRRIGAMSFSSLSVCRSPVSVNAAIDIQAAQSRSRFAMSRGGGLSSSPSISADCT